MASDASKLREECLALSEGGLRACGGRPETYHRAPIFVGIGKAGRKGLDVFDHRPAVVVAEHHLPWRHGGSRHAQRNSAEQVHICRQIVWRGRSQPEIGLDEIARLWQQEGGGVALA